MKNKKIKSAALIGSVIVGMSVMPSKSLAFPLMRNSGEVKNVKQKYELDTISKEAVEIDLDVIDSLKESLIVKLAMKSENLEKIELRQSASDKGVIKETTIGLDFSYDYLLLDQNIDVLDDLIKNFYANPSNKNVRFEVNISSENEFKDLKNGRASRYLWYCISKFDENVLSIDKTIHYGQANDWNTYEYVYKANLSKIMEDNFTNRAYVVSEREGDGVPSYKLQHTIEYDVKKDNTYRSIEITDLCVNRTYVDSIEFMDIVLDEVINLEDVQFNKVMVNTPFTLANKLLSGNLFLDEKYMTIKAELKDSSDDVKVYDVTDGFRNKEITIK